MNLLKIIPLAIVLGLLLSGCGPSESLKEEAYESGWSSAWNKKCRGIALPLMVPDKYDDSTGSGEVLGYYRAGIVDAESNPILCKE